MASMIETRRRIIAAQPHREIVQSGNTSDSATIAHFQTDLPAPLRHLKVTFAPVQAGSGTPSPSNVRPISGWNTLPVTVAGKNLFNAVWEIGGINSTNGENTIDTNRSRTGKIPIIKNQKYAIYREAAPSYAQIRGWNGETFVGSGLTVFDPISGTSGANPMQAGIQSCVIQSKDNCTAWRFVDVLSTNPNSVHYIAVAGETPPTAYEPYAGTDYTATFPSTLYGGTVDLVTGEVVVDRVKFSGTYTGLDMRMDSYTNSSVTGRIDIPTSGLPTPKQQDAIISNRFSTEWTVSGTPGRMVLVYYSSWQLYFQMPREDFAGTPNLAGVQQWLTEHPTDFVYELATPQTYQLTPQEIRTLRGVNNIWSDAGSVEVEYWTH